jgi:hypothetical protein
VHPTRRRIDGNGRIESYAFFNAVRDQVKARRSSGK